MTTSTERLVSRLNRAEGNLSELNELFCLWCDDQPYRVKTQQDIYTGEIVCYVILRKGPPTEWGSILGDVVHGLRATLDNLVWELSVAFTGSPPVDPIPAGNRWRKIGFPIITDESKWAPTLKGPLWAVDPSLTPTFKKYQPFLTGQHAPDREPLAILQELWNIDKHRHIHVVAIAAGPDPRHIFALPTQGRGIIKHVRGARELKLNTMTELFSVELDEPVLQYVDMDWKIHFDITFDQGPPAYGRDPIDFLQDVKDAVTAIVAEFEPYLP